MRSSPFRRQRVAGATLPAVAALVAAMRYELVPMRHVDVAIADLPPSAPVSVTCSPRRGLTATQDLTAHLADLGHDAVPHLAARLVEGPAHVRRLARWLRDHEVREVFVIAGDGDAPVGPYPDAITFLRQLLELDTGLARVGVPAYPDGHPTLEAATLRAALRAKQELLGSAGVAASATTQMCLDPARIRQWLTAERMDGLTVPIDVGIPGVVDRARLMRMGVRLGIGTSLRFLRSNRTTMTAMLTPGGFDPTDLVTDVASDATALGIAGLHTFTFNSVEPTAAWQRALLP